MWLQLALILLIIVCSQEKELSDCDKCISIRKVKVGGVVMFEGVPGKKWRRERFFNKEEVTRDIQWTKYCESTEFLFVTDKTSATPKTENSIVCEDGYLSIWPVKYSDSGYYWQDPECEEIEKDDTTTVEYTMPCKAIKLMVVNETEPMEEVE
ncbi:unnamed protein product [Strongylus vulgaris]|uniref:Uncharacterized protein n=1 Tax=Strongylus vulgaris TaxID=40348 RepID=A0A3P7JMJ8_STRVU|nr:unnamed protein product [Strongylus vulgaris]